MSNFFYLDSWLIRVVVFMMVLSCCIISYGNDKQKRLSGVVISKEDSTAIKNAHVINLTQIRGTSTGDDGSFGINIMEGDSIMFQAVGFKNDTVYVTEDFFRQEDHIVMELRKRVYRLPGVDVFPYSTYSEFKQAFIHFDDDKIEDTLPPIDVDLPERLYLAPTSEGFGVAVPGPITMLYEQFSQSGRERRKYREVKAEADRQDEIARVVNPEVVRRLTSLEDEAEIYDFIDYCNLSYEFIVNAKEYQVYQAILNCYRQYKNLK